MILDNFIVVRVIGLVDGAEHNAAFLSVSVLTTAPFARQLDRAASVAGNIAHAVHAHHAVAKAGRVSQCANQSGCMMPGTGDRCAPSWCAPGGHHEVAGSCRRLGYSAIYAHSQVDASRSAAQILDAALTMS